MKLLYFACTVLCVIGLTSCLSESAKSIESSVSVKFSSDSSPQLVIDKVVPLMTRNDALLGKSYNVRVASQYYVLGDRDKIVIFTKKGEIANVINTIGGGPEEASSLDFFWADNASVLVMDVAKKRILEFDFNGKFLTAVDLKERYADFARFQDRYLFDSQNKATNANNVLLLADKNGEIIKDSITIVGEGICYGGDKFQVLTDCALFLPSFSNTIYKIDKSSHIQPYYSFDFGTHWANKIECNKFINDSAGDVFALWKNLKANDKIGFLKFTDAADWIVLNYEKQDDVYNWFYNKKTKIQHIVKYKDNNAVKKKTSLLEYAVSETEDGNFLVTIPAFEYKHLTNMPKLDIDEEDNPVLVSFHIK